MIEEREWRIQCKRYKRIAANDLKKVVDEAASDDPKPAYGLVVAMACDASATAMRAFSTRAHEKGFREAHLWTNAHLEDMLFRPEYDHLLFAYFGISLGVKRNSNIQAIRRTIALKRKLLRAFESTSIDEISNTDCLVRDVMDNAYPEYQSVSGFKDMLSPPWHLIRVGSFNVNSLVVVRNGYEAVVTEDGKWDIYDWTRSSMGHSPSHYWWNNCLEAGLSQLRHDFRSDESGAADNDDLHNTSFCGSAER